MAGFTRSQVFTLIVIGIADFFNALCFALQSPFYPAEAEKKGCTATEYGLVFGIFEFVVFIVSPFYGQHLNRIGPKLTFNGGIYTTGICAILFGLLDKVEGRYAFISLSFIIRIVEAMGNAAFLTASFAIIAKEFPDNVATTFASLETFFGLGLIVGPTVGGALYQVGGYTLPFAVMGSALFASAILAAIILPKQESKRDKEPSPSVFKALKVPGIVIACASTAVTSTSIGFLQATMEPHLRVFQLKPFILGLMFVINGGVYAITAPGWGWLCDNFIPPKFVTITGSVLVAAGFCLIGPAPFFTFPLTLWVCILGLVLHGLGMAAQLVASFGDALRTAVAYDFPNNVETFGLISGLWTSTFALGAFLGPSISGILYDSVGFAHSSLFIVVIHLLVGLVTSIYICVSKKPTPYVEIKEEQLPENDINHSNTKSIASVMESMKSIRSVGNGISIEKSRPPAMNSLIACNSYTSQAWSEKDSPSVLLGPYSHSYGAVKSRSVPTAYLQGVS
ncbi:MFS-type transporter SLC18B1-like isoform X1 [Sitophilus oryzae]|uniref:MFS-type transporter SLC18B1-like isoform X1 n=1 Tax=Sitophilus oryzae TaxID=7048 RepID=A0A6J2YNX4_SITOR|nr:MFS-type transporter SLC18B1-like isoform X1 [Sitophilus oryzae]